MKRAKNGLVLLLFLLIGLVIGGVIGEIFSGTILSSGDTIGFDTVNIDLGVINIVLGLKLSINIAAIIGILISMYIYSRI